jgi:hypothetical protein
MLPSPFFSKIPFSVASAKFQVIAGDIYMEIVLMPSRACFFILHKYSANIEEYRTI